MGRQARSTFGVIDSCDAAHTVSPGQQFVLIPLPKNHPVRFEDEYETRGSGDVLCSIGRHFHSFVHIPRTYVGQAGDSNQQKTRAETFRPWVIILDRFRGTDEPELIATEISLEAIVPVLGQEHLTSRHQSDRTLSNRGVPGKL